MWFASAKERTPIGCSCTKHCWNFVYETWISFWLGAQHAFLSNQNCCINIEPLLSAGNHLFTIQFYWKVLLPLSLQLQIIQYLTVCASASYIRALVAHRYTYAPPCCRNSQYRRTFVPLSVSLWNDLADPHIRRCGTGGFQEQGQCVFYWPKLLYPYYIVFYYFYLSVYRFVLWGWGLWTDRVYIALSLPCTAQLQICTLNYWTVWSVVPFFNCGVF